jgi:hypothetical protein
MNKHILLAASIIGLSACSGIRTTDNTYAAHAESFNLLFLQIPPRDAKKRALEMVPEGAEIVNLTTTPDDLTSFISVVNRIIGIDYARVEGTLKNHE